MLTDLHFLDPEMYLGFGQQLGFNALPALVDFPLFVFIGLEVFGVAFFHVGHELVRQDVILLEASRDRLDVGYFDGGLAGLG